MSHNPPTIAYRVGRLARLPYPVRDALRRWRSMLGMVAGVGLALGIGMVMIGVSAASVDAFTADFRRSGFDLYVVTEGGKLIAILPGDTPGTIKHARATLAQVRSLPDVAAAVGLMNWTMERTREGPKVDALRERELAGTVRTMALEPRLTATGDEHYPVTIELLDAPPDVPG